MENKIDIKLKTPCECECHKKEGIVHIVPCCEGEVVLRTDYEEWEFLQEFYRDPFKHKQNGG